MKYEFHPVAGIFPLIEGEEFELLKKDIRENGLREDIWIYDGKIIDGRNRYRACLAAEVAPRFRTWDGNGSLVGFVISLNLRRRHLDPGQVAIVALRAKPFYDAEAKERMLATQNNKTARKIAASQKIDYQDAGKAAEQLGKAFGVNRQYIYDAQAISEETPDVAEKILKGEVKFAKVVKERKIVARKAKIAKQVEEIKKLAPLENKEYDVIVVDPPWEFAGDYDPEGRRANAAYPTLTANQIGKLKLPAAEDCVLWLWTTDTNLHDALHILEEWGFERKSTLIWVKDKFGLGAWLRNQHEYVLLAIRGKPMFTGQATPSVLHAGRKKHSEKPDEFYALVERTCPAPRRLDYFSRKKREGWDVYGNEVS